MTMDTCLNFNCRFVIPRLHEEVSDLRRLVGIYEEALEEIVDVNDETPYKIAIEALYVGRVDEHDDTPPPYDEAA